MPNSCFFSTFLFAQSRRRIIIIVFCQFFYFNANSCRKKLIKQTDCCYWLRGGVPFFFFLKVRRTTKPCCGDEEEKAPLRVKCSQSTQKRRGSVKSAGRRPECWELELLERLREIKVCFFSLSESAKHVWIYKYSGAALKTKIRRLMRSDIFQAKWRELFCKKKRDSIQMMH